jgi:hypothetical protein
VRRRDVHERFFGQPTAIDIDSVLDIGKSIGLSDGSRRWTRRG